MATRSLIGVMHGDICKAVYCHWDGYLMHNGAILNKYYDSAKANHLVSLGQLSSLGAEIGEQHDFNARGEYLENTGLLTTVNKECTFYGRDRGETNVDFRSFQTYDEVKEYAENSGVEFIYIMRDNVWYVDQLLRGNGLELLSEALEKLHEKETN